MYDLPVIVEISGKNYNIRNRGDYRVILDVIAALNDIDLADFEKAMCALEIFYENLEDIPHEHMEAALKEVMTFINCGDCTQPPSSGPSLMDWEQDFKLLVAPVNRVLGCEIRSTEYLHWWTFISAYYEIGECSFASVVSIRSKQKKGKKLEKWEQEFLRDNREIVELKTKTSKEEQSFINEILGME